MPGTRAASGLTLTCGEPRAPLTLKVAANAASEPRAGQDLADDRDPAQDPVDRVGGRHGAADVQLVGAEIDGPIGPRADVAARPAGPAPSVIVSPRSRNGATSRCTGTPCPARAFDRPVNEASEMIRAMVGAPHRVKLRIRRSPEPARSLSALVEVGRQAEGAAADAVVGRAQRPDQPARIAAAQRGRGLPAGGVGVEADLAVLDVGPHRGTLPDAVAPRPRSRTGRRTGHRRAATGWRSAAR